ncbi:conserved hypothetical protein [Paecilomyces variotii No. 5]|uniref:ATP-grasp domain-containing protein n=1 Tax=Byssochlamys spectabilis (strain No. 5 / NBRC 109023) TaxID=1356009 RepID=V5F7T7_BYSSN|nr:conserved hypothetical protein [Paecilomyces variotii No. 5]
MARRVFLRAARALDTLPISVADCHDDNSVPDPLYHLFLIAISVALLPIDTSILLASYLLGSLPLPGDGPNLRRHTVLEDAQFYPKTILITGVDTPHGLALARLWYYAGHRVVGADVGNLAVRSAGSMSKTISAYYHILKPQYVSCLLDIIKREKVDLWIPCSDMSSAAEDAVAKEIVESRTECKCIHFGTDLATIFGQTDTFTQWIFDKGLPLVEKHYVRSRDAVHKILHRSPTKTYLMRKMKPAEGDRLNALSLPKKTPSQTYSDVSVIRVTKDEPWVLCQQVRAGEYFADMLLVHGQIKAFRARPARSQSGFGESRLDEGLSTAIYNVMQTLATKGGPRMTGHLSVKLLVDEEITGNSVKHVVYIGDCEQGTAAVQSLLQDPTSNLAPAYLSALTPHVNGVHKAGPGASEHDPVQDFASTAQKQYGGVSKTVDDYITKFLPTRQVSKAVSVLAEQTEHLLVWKDPRFWRLDPLPWWWEAHVCRPLKEFNQLSNESKGVKAS